MADSQLGVSDSRDFSSDETAVESDNQVEVQSTLEESVSVSDTTADALLIKEYIALVDNVPCELAISKTLEWTEDNLLKLESLRNALFYSAGKCPSFPKGSFTLKKRINRGEKASYKLAKDCVLLSVFLAEGDYEDIQDMLNNVSGSRLIDTSNCASPRVRGRDLSLSQESVSGTHGLGCSTSDFKELIAQLRTDMAMLKSSNDTLKCDIAELRTDYASLCQSTVNHQEDADMAMLKASNDTLNNSIAALRSDYDSLRQSTVNHQTDMAMLKASNGTLISDLAALRSDYDSLCQSAVNHQTDQAASLTMSEQINRLFSMSDNVSGEITDLIVAVGGLKEHKNSGLALNRSMINDLADKYKELKQIEEKSVEKCDAMWDTLATVDKMSETVSTLSKKLVANSSEVADLKRHVDRLGDDRSMGIAQVKAEIKSSKQQISDIDGKVEFAVQSQKSQFEGYINLRARLAHLEKSVSDVTKKSESVSDTNDVTNSANGVSLEKSISVTFSSMAHDMKSQFEELTNTMKYSLSQIAETHTKFFATRDHRALDSLGPPAPTCDAEKATHSKVVNIAYGNGAASTSASSWNAGEATQLETVDSVHSSHVPTVTALHQSDAVTDSQLLGETHGDDTVSHPKSTCVTTSAWDKPLLNISKSSELSNTGTTQTYGFTPAIESDSSHAKNSIMNIPVRIGNDQCASTKGVYSTKPVIDGGFVGVTRRHTVRFFLSGINKNSKAQDIKDFLADRNVAVSVVRLMSSRRQDAQSARVNILKEDVGKIDDRHFWPRGVNCRKWQPKAKFDKRRNDSFDGSEYADDCPLSSEPIS